MSTSKDTPAFDFISAVVESKTVEVRFSIPTIRDATGKPQVFSQYVRVVESGERDRLGEIMQGAGAGLEGEKREAAIGEAVDEIWGNIVSRVAGYGAPDVLDTAEVRHFFRGRSLPKDLSDEDRSRVLDAMQAHKLAAVRGFFRSHALDLNFR